MLKPALRGWSFFGLHALGLLINEVRTFIQQPNRSVFAFWLLGLGAGHSAAPHSLFSHDSSVCLAFIGYFPSYSDVHLYKLLL